MTGDVRAAGLRRIRIVTAGLGVAAAAASLGIAAVVQDAHAAATPAVVEEPVATVEEEPAAADPGPVQSTDRAPHATSGGS